MYWSVYAAANLPTSFRSPGKSKKTPGRIRSKMRRSHPYSSSYQTMDIDEDSNQAFERTLSKLQKRKNSKFKRAKSHKKSKKIINNRTAAKQFHMQLKATMSVVKHEDSLNEAISSLLKKEGINNDMLRSTIIHERSSDYSLQSIQKSQSLATNPGEVFGICSPYQYSTHQQTAFGVEMGNETRDIIQPYNQFIIKVANNDDTDEVEERFKRLSVNSRNELMNEFCGYHN
jgi:hypothetical protein